MQEHTGTIDNAEIPMKTGEISINASLVRICNIVQAVIW